MRHAHLIRFQQDIAGHPEVQIEKLHFRYIVRVLHLIVKRLGDRRRIGGIRPDFQERLAFLRRKHVGIADEAFLDGFALADMTGSRANDPIRMKDGKPYTTTNRNGGVNGGITNGMPVIFRCAVKPTPSIAQEQQTVDPSAGEETTLTIKGRHDPAIVHRARVVVDSVTALALCDLLVLRYGTDWLAAR